MLPDHEHFQFSDEAAVPRKWRDYLNCRQCKQQLVLYLGKAFVTHVPDLLSGEQRLVVARCFEEGKALSITPSGMQLCPLLTSNADESDTMVWLHVVHSAGTRKLVFSPDTDVYHIGLPLLNSYTFDVYVQLCPASSPELKLFHLNQLHLALAADPDLATVPPDLQASVLQTLFICNGCDYLSFFAGFGKATMMKHFFMNAWFITGTQDSPGTLTGTAPGRLDDGFLSFIRLIGTVYFKKHLAELTVNTPCALYMLFSRSDVGPMQQHKQFLEAIRERIWCRIQFEDELPPSFDALWRHWLRTC